MKFNNKSLLIKTDNVPKQAKKEAIKLNKQLNKSIRELIDKKGFVYTYRFLTLYFLEKRQLSFLSKIGRIILVLISSLLLGGIFIRLSSLSIIIFLLFSACLFWCLVGDNLFLLVFAPLKFLELLGERFIPDCKKINGTLLLFGLLPFLWSAFVDILVLFKIIFDGFTTLLARKRWSSLKKNFSSLEMDIIANLDKWVALYETNSRREIFAILNATKKEEAALNPFPEMNCSKVISFILLLMVVVFIAFSAAPRVRQWLKGTVANMPHHEKFSRKIKEANEMKIIVCPEKTEKGHCDYFGGDGIQEAVNHISYNGIIILKPGHYYRNEASEFLLPNGKKMECFLDTKGKTFTLENDDSTLAVQHTVLDGVKSAPMDGICAKSGAITIKRITISGFSNIKGKSHRYFNGIFLSGSAQASIQESIITHNEGGVTVKNLARATIKDSEIKNNAVGVFLDGDFGVETIIENNIIADNLNEGIEVDKNAWAVIRGNVISNNGSIGIHLYNSAWAEIDHSTLVKNFDAGIWFNRCNDTYPPTIISNNIIAFSKRGCCGASGCGIGDGCWKAQQKLVGVSFSNNLLWRNRGNYKKIEYMRKCWDALPSVTVIRKDPLFVDKDNDNYHLKPNSPACQGKGEKTYIGAYSCRRKLNVNNTPEINNLITLVEKKFKENKPSKLDKVLKRNDLRLWWISPDNLNINSEESPGVELRVFSYFDGQQENTNLHEKIKQQLTSEIDGIMQKHHFILNKRNSYTSFSGSQFYDYARGYKKGETRCIFTIVSDSGCYDYGCLDGLYSSYTFQCTREYSKNYRNQAPLLKSLGIKQGGIDPFSLKREGNFLKLATFGRKNGTYIIAKLIKGKWKIILEDHGLPSCETITKYSIPDAITPRCSFEK